MNEVREEITALNSSEHLSPFPNLVVDPKSLLITDVNIALQAEDVARGLLPRETFVGKKITDFVDTDVTNLRNLLKQSLHVSNKFLTLHETQNEEGIVWPTVPVNHPVLGRRLLQIRPIRFKDGDKKSNAFHVVLKDVTATYYDDLTAVANRRFFLELAAKDLARAQIEQSPIAFGIFDIDFFKKVNDIYGHSAGDLVLQEVAAMTSAWTQQIDTVGRLGGEEFSVCLPGVGSPLALEAAEMLRNNIESVGELPIADDHFMPFPTISIGIVSYDGLHDLPISVDIAMSYADLAMYAAKRDGRNRVALCYPRKDKSAVILVIEIGEGGYKGTWYYSQDSKLEHLQVIQGQNQEPNIQHFTSLDDAGQYFGAFKNIII